MKKNALIIILTIFGAIIVPISAMAWGTSKEYDRAEQIIIDHEAVHLHLYERCLQINPDGAESFKEVTDKWGKKNYPALREIRLILRDAFVKEGMSVSDADAKISKVSKWMTDGIEAKFTNLSAEEFLKVCSRQSAEELTSQMDFVAFLDKYHVKMLAQKENEPKPIISGVPSSNSKKENEPNPVTNSIPSSEPKTEERFVENPDGTVSDTKTKLMWAAQDNGRNISWENAKSYCENYNGGGYTDWRMPTQKELAGLYDPASEGYKPSCAFTVGGVSAGKVYLTNLIRLSCWWGWASETRGSEAASYYFYPGARNWNLKSDNSTRALPVRSVK
jgi:hypothetical protein